MSDPPGTADTGRSLDDARCVCGHRAAQHNGPFYATGTAPGHASRGCDECPCAYLAYLQTEFKGQLRGHGLLHEGQIPHPWGSGTIWSTGEGPAICRCGWRSEVLETNAARKRAHRAHKAEVAAQSDGRTES